MVITFWSLSYHDRFRVQLPWPVSSVLEDSSDGFNLLNSIQSKNQIQRNYAVTNSESTKFVTVILFLTISSTAAMTGFVFEEINSKLVTTRFFLPQGTHQVNCVSMSLRMSIHIKPWLRVPRKGLKDILHCVCVCRSLFG